MRSNIQIFWQANTAMQEGINQIFFGQTSLILGIGFTI